MTDDLEKPCHQELSGIEGPLARKLKEQADRIKQLEAALREIVEQERQTAHPVVVHIIAIAREALEGKDD